jgi:hypothetical protein
MMDDRPELKQKEFTVEDLNVFAETANQQASLLARWISTFNSYDLEFIDTFSQHKDRITLAKFYDRIGQLQKNGRSEEALDMTWLALHVLHTYLDNQLVPRLQEVVRVNDAAQTAATRMMESAIGQRSASQKEIADLKQQVASQAEVILATQTEAATLREKLDLLQFYIDTKNSGRNLNPDMAELLLHIERLFTVDKLRATQPTESAINSPEEFITKQSQQKKKAVGLIREVL